MEDESGVTRSINYELHSSYIQRAQMEDESDVTSNIIYELYSGNIQKDQMEGEIVLLEVSLMNFILRISK